LLGHSNHIAFANGVVELGRHKEEGPWVGNQKLQLLEWVTKSPQMCYQNRQNVGHHWFETSQAQVGFGGRISKLKGDGVVLDPYQKLFVLAKGRVEWLEEQNEALIETM
jgi:hypothetical protein